MPPLLEKLKRLRHPEKRQSPTQGERRRFWIWLSVCLVFLIGAYFWYTSARILGEPIDVGYGPGESVFTDTLGPLLGGEFTGGNEVRTLINGERFFPAMLEAIRHAEKTITLETYIWSSGKISNQFIDALSERARQGVKVHVLADGMGTLKLADEDKRRMKEAGIQYVVYGREHWYDIKPNINHRTHRKLLVVDGRIGFTGGCCIDDHWLGNADSPSVWRETQVRVKGPAVRQIQATFAANWMQTTGRLLAGPDYFPEPEREGSSLAECYRSGPNENMENARIAYLLAIAAARKTIRIANAYFVPDDLAVEMLVRARKRGVRIQVIVPAINDSRIGRAASRSRWGKLLEAGVEFYRYLPAMYHCKVMIVDDVFVTVGSVNFDNRSFAINDEAGLNVIDPDVASDHLKSFAADLKRSEPYTLQDYRSRSVWMKGFDSLCGTLRSQL
ncbi:cardiolipin synthase B [Opitutaceae bacterium EW11]|nr:cardiolipin synthase B [Opitutaceae bacterium EW11]